MFAKFMNKLDELLTPLFLAAAISLLATVQFLQYTPLAGIATLITRALLALSCIACLINIGWSVWSIVYLCLKGASLRLTLLLAYHIQQCKIWLWLNRLAYGATDWWPELSYFHSALRFTGERGIYHQDMVKDIFFNRIGARFINGQNV